jgi:hypothetical protein
MHMLRTRLQRADAVERMPPRQQLVADTCQRIDIVARIDLLTFELLATGIGRRSRTVSLGRP